MKQKPGCLLDNSINHVSQNPIVSSNILFFILVSPIEEYVNSYGDGLFVCCEKFCVDSSYQCGPGTLYTTELANDSHCRDYHTGNPDSRDLVGEKNIQGRGYQKRPGPVSPEQEKKIKVTIKKATTRTGRN
jgi:hypothetical protein